MHNIRREKYFDIVSEGKENISSVFCSNWLRLITVCENIALFWSCGPDCGGESQSKHTGISLFQYDSRFNMFKDY